MNRHNNQQTSLHPLLQIDNLVKERGVVVLNDVDRMPLYDEAYISPYAMIALCQQGNLKAEYDMTPVEFHPHDITFMRPRHVVKAHASSADYKARLIVMSSAFFEQFRQSNPPLFNARILYYSEHPAYHLTDEQYRQIGEAFDLLQTVSSIGKHYREEMMRNVLYTLLMMRYEFAPIPTDGQQNANRQLSSRFKEAVIEHHHKSHEVSFYARMFYLSPKYFSTLIKEETGIGAKEWIENYVALQAKQLLHTHPELSIQQIAERLGFSEPSSFSRFFKTQTSMSPLEYRGRHT